MCTLTDKVSAGQAAHSSAAPEPVAGRPCPSPSTEAEKKPEALPWELTVRVKSLDVSRQPQNVTVTLETIAGGSGTKTINPTTPEFKAEEGKGDRSFRVSARADKWELVEEKTVSLADGDKKTVEVELRPKPWKLRVRIKSQEATRYPETVTLSIETLTGGSGVKTRSLSMSQQTEELLVEEGTGERKFKVSASADKWDLIGAKEETLQDGDAKTVELELRPKAWIAFKVMHKDKLVPNVTLKLTLPASRKEDPVSADKEIRIDGLEPGTCKLEAISHPDMIWEVEEVTPS